MLSYFLSSQGRYNFRQKALPKWHAKEMTAEFIFIFILLLLLLFAAAAAAAATQ